MIALEFDHRKSPETAIKRNVLAIRNQTSPNYNLVFFQKVSLLATLPIWNTVSSKVQCL